MAALLQLRGRSFEYLDARRVLVVDEEAPTGPQIMWHQSQAKLAAFLAEIGPLCGGDCAVPRGLLITGFIASTTTGAPTTLKRDGSDYSASIFGKLLRAAGVTIWTDVDGVLSADPRRVPEAYALPEVSEPTRCGAALDVQSQSFLHLWGLWGGGAEARAARGGGTLGEGRVQLV